MCEILGKSNSRKQLYPWAPLSKQLDVAVHKRYVNEILQWLLGYRDDNVPTLLPSDWKIDARSAVSGEQTTLSDRFNVTQQILSQTDPKYLEKCDSYEYSSNYGKILL